MSAHDDVSELTNRARQLSARHQICDDRVLGTPAWISEENRLRAVQSVRFGQVFSLSRPLAAEPPLIVEGDPTRFEFASTVHSKGRTFSGRDHVELAIHGFQNTHVDALNHFGVDETWYGGVAADDGTPEVALGIDGWAKHGGLVTRGVVADVPGWRNVDYVPFDDRVTGQELDQILAAAGEDFLPGDALLLHMGRDLFEEQHAGSDAVRYGRAVEPSVAEWLADHGASVLCWDFLDSGGAGTPDYGTMPVHLMIWAIGIALVDNCSFAQLIPAVRAQGSYAGLLTVAPLWIKGATGSCVNPTLLV